MSGVIYRSKENAVKINIVFIYANVTLFFFSSSFLAVQTFIMSNFIANC